MRSTPQLKQVPAELTLVQHGDRVIPELNHQSLSEFTLKKLTENGIEVLLNTAAAEVTTRGVVLKSGRLLASKLIVNTIGTEPVELISRLGFELERGRIKTDSSMQVPDADNLWALGDCAITINAFDGQETWFEESQGSQPGLSGFAQATAERGYHSSGGHTQIRRKSPGLLGDG